MPVYVHVHDHLLTPASCSSVAKLPKLLSSYGLFTRFLEIDLKANEEAFAERVLAQLHKRELITDDDELNDQEDEERVELSPYQILGVTPGLSSSELNARYRQLMSANHPDKVAHLDPEIQAFASERARRIIEAYEAISAGWS